MLQFEKCASILTETMDIQVVSDADRRIVQINGKITFEHCPTLQSHLDRVIDEGVREVVVDFKGVPFIDSSGIGEILRLFKLVSKRKGRLVLINPNPKLHNLFTMYRFENFMEIRNQVEDAKE